MMLRATISHLIIPPKILTRIPSRRESSRMISNAAVIDSLSAPPPMSRKFAGSPPYNLITSIVAIAKPAPLTKQPMFPSKSTYESPCSCALTSTSDSSEMSLRSSLHGCLNAAFSSKLTFASKATIDPFPSLTRGFISIIEQSFSVNRDASLTIISANELREVPDSPRESPREWATSSLRPSDG